MTYFCFIESSTSSTPHMEPLVSDLPDDAIGEATDLMRLHSSAIAAHVFFGDERVASVVASDPPVVLRSADAPLNTAA